MKRRREKFITERSTEELDRSDSESEERKRHSKRHHNNRRRSSSASPRRYSRRYSDSDSEYSNSRHHRSSRSSHHHHNHHHNSNSHHYHHRHRRRGDVSLLYINWITRVDAQVEYVALFRSSSIHRHRILSHQSIYWRSCRCIQGPGWKCIFTLWFITRSKVGGRKRVSCANIPRACWSNVIVVMASLHLAKKTLRWLLLKVCTVHCWVPNTLKSIVQRYQRETKLDLEMYHGQTKVIALLL